MNNVLFTPFFASPVMEVELDLDLEKLTEFAFQMQNKDKKGVQRTNMGGWHSDFIQEEKHEEFIKLKKEITHYSQIYRSEIFRGMKFKENVVQSLSNLWVNINEKDHYNCWHIHGYSTLSGVYYIKHDGSLENGVISFKHPEQNIACPNMHWPLQLIEENNEISAGVIDFLPKAGKLLIFPSWIQHKVEANLKDSVRISVSFNSIITPEIK